MSVIKILAGASGSGKTTIMNDLADRGELVWGTGDLVKCMIGAPRMDSNTLFDRGRLGSEALKFCVENRSALLENYEACKAWPWFGSLVNTLQEAPRGVVHDFHAQTVRAVCDLYPERELWTDTINIEELVQLALAIGSSRLTRLYVLNCIDPKPSTSAATLDNRQTIDSLAASIFVDVVTPITYRLADSLTLF